MDKQVIEQLRQIFYDYLHTHGFCLVDFLCRYESRGWVLQIIIDRPQGGISLHECVVVNNQIGRILDEKNLLDEHYILEVSSPGVDRPLKIKEDFLRCINRRVKIFLIEPMAGKIELEGEIAAVGDDAVFIREVSGTTLCVSLSNIKKAKQQILKDF